MGLYLNYYDYYHGSVLNRGHTPIDTPTALTTPYNNNNGSSGGGGPNPIEKYLFSSNNVEYEVDSKHKPLLTPAETFKGSVLDITNYSPLSDFDREGGVWKTNYTPRHSISHTPERVNSSDGVREKTVSFTSYNEINRRGGL